MGSFRLFARICFGARGRRLWQSLLVCLFLYGALSPLALQMAAAPFLFCLMPGLFSAGVMLHALRARAQAAQLRHLLMLPVDNSALVYGYVSALAAYVLLTRTAPLLALMLAVLDWQEKTLLAALLCAVNGVLLPALLTAWRRNSWVLLPWFLLLAGGVWWLNADERCMVLLGISALAACWLLKHVDAQALLLQEADVRARRHSVRRGWMLHYFCRYLWAHKNYLVNTAALWMLALAMPLILHALSDGRVMVPLGLALLTLNTPLCILLSCDPALETAVRTLPRQRRCFCLPYAALLFASALCSEALFLMSWQVVHGGVTVFMLLLAVYVSLQSAVANVWLEWRWPLKKWRLESDLWHHPRKYLVPGMMLLAAMGIGSWPILLVPLSLALVLEMVVLLRRKG